MNTKITSVGHYVPERVITNHDLEKMMDTSDEWIRERTGIEERRWAETGKDTTSNMGVKAVRIALERANLSPDDVDFIIFATLSPDYFFPEAGVLVQKELNIKTVGTLDISEQCSGFVYGLSVVDQYIKSGMYKTILVIGSEVQSTILDINTCGRNISFIFDDGAGAAIVTSTKEKNIGILSTHLHSQGEFAEELMLREPGRDHASRIYEGMLEDYEGIYPRMNGSFVFKHAVTRFPEVVKEALDATGYKPEDIDMFVPHQANYRITKYAQKQPRLKDDQVCSNIHKYGNTTAASIPIALSESWEEKRIKENDLVVLAAFGSGFTWASAIIRW